MVQKFKAGDVVICRDTYCDNMTQFISRGIKPSITPLTVLYSNEYYVYFYDNGEGGWYHHRFKMVGDVPNDPWKGIDKYLPVPDIDRPSKVVPEEPDLYVYPDTPVGTELIVTQDTVTLYGNVVPKGTIVTLYKPEYTGQGGFRKVKNLVGLKFNIDCDHLMIKG